MNKLLLSIIVLSLMLAAALGVAVLGAPKSFTQAAAAGLSGSKKEIVAVYERRINGETQAGEVRMLFEDAPELPDEAAQAFGLFLALEGDKILLGGGAIDVEVTVGVVNDRDPVRQVNAFHSGEQTSFRVGPQTVYLQDITSRPEISEEDFESGQIIVVGAVAAGSLADLENLAATAPLVLRVWGVYRGGELLADLVVYDVVE
ncbi:hypothetical protein ACFLZW_01980 [Chloroflexota bacterium]